MTEKLLASTCPTSGDVVWQGPCAAAEAVVAAVDNARAAFARWRAVPLGERLAIARAYGQVLRARTAELAELISRETGKPLWEARQEVASMAGKVDISIAAQGERAGDRQSQMPFGQAVLRHRPHGVMAVLGPYNFPGHLPNGHIVPALIAGNTVVFKPSELTPGVGEAIGRAWADAGLPEGVLAVVQGGRDTGAALLESEIDGLLFTGSATTGMHIRRRFADRPEVILALELGGNNPLVVWDGSIDEAAAIIVQSAFITSGQRCSCARRLILPHGRFGDGVIGAVEALVQRLPIGAWYEDPEPYMGPLVSEHAAKLVRQQVDGLLKLGARPIVPLADVQGYGPAFLRPALLETTMVDAPDEEIFGPVLQVVRVDSFDSAMSRTNDTRFGLSAGLVSEDDGLWERFVIEARAGVVNRNRPTTGAAGSMPFGGVGDSGNHRPSAYYAADYCAYPTASFEAPTPSGNATALSTQLRA